MTALDPAFVTVVGSCLGAVTFFAAGYVWKTRPRLADADPSSASKLAGDGQLIRLSPAKATPRAPDPTLRPARVTSVAAGLSIEQTLKQLERAMGAKSCMVFDAAGLALTRGPESTRIGARLASLLVADRAQTGGKSETDRLNIVQAGPVRIQRLESRSALPEAWLVCLHARRFAVQKELDLVSIAMGKVLGKSLAEDPFA